MSVSAVGSSNMTDPSMEQFNKQMIQDSCNDMVSNEQDQNDQANKDMKEVWDQFQ